MGTLRQGLKKEKSYLLSIEGNIILYLLAKQFVYCCGNFISCSPSLQAGSFGEDC